jgi:hypothetical protein
VVECLHERRNSNPSIFNHLFSVHALCIRKLTNVKRLAILCLYNPCNSTRVINNHELSYKTALRVFQTSLKTWCTCLCMYMYVCIYLSINVYTYVCVFACIYVYICMYVCIYMHVCTYVFICMYMYVCI